jgi:hypothetical protein
VRCCVCSLLLQRVLHPFSHGSLVLFRPAPVLLVQALALVIMYASTLPTLSRQAWFPHLSGSGYVLLFWGVFCCSVFCCRMSLGYGRKGTDCVVLPGLRFWLLHTCVSLKPGRVSSHPTVDRAALWGSIPHSYLPGDRVSFS